MPVPLFSSHLPSSEELKACFEGGGGRPEKPDQTIKFAQTMCPAHETEEVDLVSEIKLKF